MRVGEKMEILGSILSACVAGGLALIGVIITNNSANNKMQMENKTAQAVTDNKIENLTNEVRKHNRFAERIPVLEEKVKKLEEDVDELKQR